MYKFISLVLLICFPSIINGKTDTIQSEKVSILFIGDIMCHDDQIISAKKDDTPTYDFDDVFNYIKAEISGADFAIANFESTLAGPPYSGYPLFSSPTEFALACSDAGIDYFMTANNHAADRKGAGILKTLNQLDSLGIKHTGTFADQTSRDSLYPVFFEKKGISFALLNYTYGINDITVTDPIIVNMLNKELIARDIEKAKEQKTDFIILFLHWGVEYDTIPSISQNNMADYLFSLGVNVIIGSHPHVLQKMEWITDVPKQENKIIAYSLGNFISNQRKPGTDGGAMFRIDFEKREDSLLVSNAGYYLTWVYIPENETDKEYFVLPCSQFENKPEFFQEKTHYDQMRMFSSCYRKFLQRQNKNINEIKYTGNDSSY